MLVSIGVQARPYHTRIFAILLSYLHNIKCVGISHFKNKHILFVSQIRVKHGVLVVIDKGLPWWMATKRYSKYLSAYQLNIRLILISLK